MISCQSGFTVKMKNAEDLMLCSRIWFIFSLHQSPLSIPVKYSGESSFKETDYITGYWSTSDEFDPDDTACSSNTKSKCVCSRKIKWRIDKEKMQ